MPGFGDFSSFTGGGLLNAGLDFASAEYFRDKSSDEATASREFNRDEASAQRAWSERMSNTQYQRSVADIQAAGLNPMLAYQHGGAGVPGGAVASSSPAGSTPAPSMSGAMLHSAQQKLVDSQAANVDADTSLKASQQKEVEARTGTYAVSIDQMTQQIQESKAKIESLMADTAHGYASAAQASQQTENLRAQLPQIQAMVRQLNALATLNEAQVKYYAAQTGKSVAEMQEISQRVNQNMPEVQRALADLEKVVAENRAASAQVERPVHESMFGKLGALMRVLNPLTGLIAVSK